MVINWANTTTPAQLLASPNYNTGGWFWLGMLFMVFFVMILLFMKRGINVALMTSAFVCLILGIFLTYMNVLDFSYVLVFAGIIVINIIYIMWGKKAEY